MAASKKKNETTDLPQIEWRASVLSAKEQERFIRYCWDLLIPEDDEAPSAFDDDSSGRKLGIGVIPFASRYRPESGPRGRDERGDPMPLAVNATRGQCTGFNERCQEIEDYISKMLLGHATKVASRQDENSKSHRLMQEVVIRRNPNEMKQPATIDENDAGRGGGNQALIFITNEQHANEVLELKGQMAEVEVERRARMKAIAEKVKKQGEEQER